jgi:hypothetical protein
MVLHATRYQLQISQYGPLFKKCGCPEASANTSGEAKLRLTFGLARIGDGQLQTYGTHPTSGKDMGGRTRRGNSINAGYTAAALSLDSAARLKGDGSPETP